MVTGRAEVNIKPWRTLIKELEEGNRRVKWRDREPYAYWKGNPWVSDSRSDLMRCNVSKHHDWNARLYALVRHTTLHLLLLRYMPELNLVLCCRTGTVRRGKDTRTQTWQANASIGELFFSSILHSFSLLLS